MANAPFGRLGESRQNILMPLYSLGDLTPVIHETSYVHPDAVIIGNVRLAPYSSVWPAAVLRGDRGMITVGASTSIQDGSVIHCTASADTYVGANCVVGHNSHLEGCRIEDNCMVGSSSTVLAGAVIGPWSLVAAGALVPPGMEVPAHTRAMGVPARLYLDAVQEGDFDASVETYVENASWYRDALTRIETQIESQT